jgi:hypothetical protein
MSRTTYNHLGCAIGFLLMLFACAGLLGIVPLD